MKFGLKSDHSLDRTYYFSLLLVIGYGSLYYGPQKNLLISINYLWLSLLFIWLIFFCLRLAQKGLKKLCSRGFILTGQHRINNEFLDFF